MSADGYYPLKNKSALQMTHFSPTLASNFLSACTSLFSAKAIRKSVYLSCSLVFNFTGTVFSQTTDTIPPVAIAQNVTIFLNTGGNAVTAAAAVDNGSSDESGIASITLSKTSFNCSNVGDNPVVLTVTDINGNQATATAVVTVVDAIAPIVFANNVTVILDANGNGITTASAAIFSIIEACGIASRTLSKTNFDCSNVGANNVMLTVTDINGNATNSNVVVNVKDLMAPDAVAQNATVTLVNGTAIITAAQINNGSSDNCSIVNMKVSPYKFTCANIGMNTVTLWVTDASGNTSTTTATVTVEGVMPTCNITAVPSGVVIGSTNTYAGNNQLFLGYGNQSMSLTNIGAAGDSADYSWTGTGLSSYNTANTIFTPVAGGNYTFTSTVTNSNGCKATCSITICVIDVRDPENSGKVLICHVPKGNPLNSRTLRVSVNAVQAHVGRHGGDKLGSCDAVCGMAKGNRIGEVYSEETTTGDVHLVVYPNPSNKEFNFKLETQSEELVNFRVYDMSGRLVLEKTDLSPADGILLNTITLSGIYMAEVTQGDFHKVVKITKVD